MTPAFDQALAAMDAGDLAGLRRVLAAHPQVVHERVDTNARPYDGYFQGATLLHHVAGNPIRGPVPANIVEVARTLIEAGADVKALCGDKGGGTVMGLVASGAPMAESGLYRPMIDLLIASGYSFDDEPRLLAVCLYHTVECQKQREVGEYLAAKGAKVDLVFAAALGRTDLVPGLIAGDGRVPEALVWAAMNGREATIAVPSGVCQSVSISTTANAPSPSFETAIFTMLRRLCTSVWVSKRCCQACPQRWRS